LADTKQTPRYFISCTCCSTLSNNLKGSHVLSYRSPILIKKTDLLLLNFTLKFTAKFSQMVACGAWRPLSVTTAVSCINYTTKQFPAKRHPSLETLSLSVKRLYKWQIGWVTEINMISVFRLRHWAWSTCSSTTGISIVSPVTDLARFLWQVRRRIHGNTIITPLNDIVRPANKNASL